MTLIKEKNVVQEISDTNEIRYQAIDKLTSESRDLSAYRNIEKWSRHLCELFDRSVLPYSRQHDFQLNTDIEVIVNNYTFMLVFMGEKNESQRALELVIVFWKNRYLETGDSQYLLKTLQPIINLSRLFLMSNNYAGFWRIINELSLDENGKIKLYGTEYNSELIKTHLKFIKYAAFKETLKAHLKSKNHQYILNMESLLPDELSKTIYYREAQIISLFYLGKLKTAESIIRGVMFKTIGIEQNTFYYRLYESYKCQNMHHEAEVVLREIKLELNFEPLNNLKDLIFASTVIKEAGLLPADDLSKKVLSEYKKINDEMNYANLLLWFHKNFRTQEIENQLKNIFQKSHYQYLRLSISAELNVSERSSAARWNNKLNDRFDTFFTIEPIDG